MKKEEIRHDLVRDKIINVASYIEDNFKTFLMGFAAVLICLFLYNYNLSSRENNKIDSLVSSGIVQNKLISGDYEGALLEFENILIERKSENASMHSLIYLINNYYKDENITAIDSLLRENFDTVNDKYLRSRIYVLLGDLYTNQYTLTGEKISFEKAKNNYNSSINLASINIMESYIKKIDLLMMENNKSEAIDAIDNAKSYMNDKLENNKLSIPGYYVARINEYIAMFALEIL